MLEEKYKVLKAGSHTLFAGLKRHKTKSECRWWEMLQCACILFLSVRHSTHTHCLLHKLPYPLMLDSTIPTKRNVCDKLPVQLYTSSHCIPKMIHWWNRSQTDKSVTKQTLKNKILNNLHINNQGCLFKLKYVYHQFKQLTLSDY